MTFRFLRALLFGAVLCAGATVPALAGPPYETDDPEPTAYRHYEIYVFSAGATGNVAPAATYTSPGTVIGLGLAP